MTPRIFGPKQLNITTANVFTYDFVFNSVDFASTGNAVVSGPLSLAVDVNNPTYRLVYIGVIIQTTENIITTEDRYNLAFCPGLTNITISPASVPSFAMIQGDIVSITVRMFAFTQTVPSSSQIATVYIRLDNPVPIVAPTPLIGRDTQALEPGLFQTDRYQFANPNYPGLTIPANTPSTQRVLAFTNFHSDSNLWRFRLRIVSVYIIIAPTPFPGDVIAEMHFLDAGAALANNHVSPILTVFSETDRVVVVNQNLGFTILGTEAVSVVAYNQNATRDGKAAAQLFFEVKY